MKSTGQLKMLGVLLCALTFGTFGLGSTTVLEFFGNENTSYVNLGNNPGGSQFFFEETPYTMEGWVAFKSLGASDWVFNQSRERQQSHLTFLLGFEGDELRTRTGGQPAGTRVANRWYHLACSFDGELTTLYLDGIPIGTVPTDFGPDRHTLNNDNAWLKLGGWNAATDIDGFMSDVRFWDHARSDEDIRVFRNRRLSGQEAGLVGYWPLNDGTGSTAQDVTGNGSNGALAGTTDWAQTDSLALLAPPVGFAYGHAFALHNLETGSTRFSNSNRVEIAGVQPPADYDEYLLTESEAQPSLDADWQPIAQLPNETEWTFSGTQNNAPLNLYAWFTNTTDTTATLVRSDATITYTEALPSPAAIATLTRETGGFSVAITGEELDAGSTGGFAGETPMGISSLNVVWLSGDAPDATPDDPFVTLPGTGSYTLALEVVNEAGNRSQADATLVTVIEATDLPEADRYVVLNNVNAAAPHDSRTNAAASIQAAVAVATPNDTILIWPGRYTAEGAGTSVVHIVSAQIGGNSLTLRAAWASENGEPTVVVDGEGVNRGVTVFRPSRDDGWGQALTFEGIAFVNGYATSGGAISALGGDIRAMTLNLIECVIRDNVSTGSGGGIVFHRSAAGGFLLNMTRCIVIDNQAISGHGGGIMASNLKIVDSLIENNRSGGDGGGIVGSTFFEIENSRIIGNWALGDGGAIYTYVRGATDPPSILRNVLIANNEGNQGRAIFHDRLKTLQLYNCTIADNTGGTSDVIRFNGPRTPTTLELFNTIIYGGNTGVHVGGTGSGATINFQHNCMPEDYVATDPNVEGFGNITAPPLYATAAAGDYRLSSGSPCINAGINQDWMDTATDLDGNPRLDSVHRIVDMGAFETQFRGTIILVR